MFPLLECNRNSPSVSSIIQASRFSDFASWAGNPCTMLARGSLTKDFVHLSSNALLKVNYLVKTKLFLLGLAY